jgi:protein OS-9
VLFADSFISQEDASLIIDHAPSSSGAPLQSSSTNSIEPNNPKPNSKGSHAFDPAHETYELMQLDGEPYLCSIPTVEPPVRNETSEAEARAAEQKELARASDRGWELLQDLEGNCLYYVSGWWSYSFCYNSEIIQFHPLPPQAGKPAVPPQRDPATKQYILGKAKPSQSREDEWGNHIDVHKGKNNDEPPKTELQVKGDTRYLAQKMEGGTTCDLTGKARKVEVQYHCNPHVTDRIGYIKEVTTCSYLMVVYTPRLCNDVAFMPPPESKANEIVCRAIVPEDDMDDRNELRLLEAELDAANAELEKPINIGGLILGAGKWASKDGQRMPIPANFGKEPLGRSVEVIAQAKSKAEGGQIEQASDATLQKMDLDPNMVDVLRKKVQKIAKDKGWKIEVVDGPGQLREILGIVDDDEDEGDGEVDVDGDGDHEEDEEGSQEIFKEEL